MKYISFLSALVIGLVLSSCAPDDDIEPEEEWFPMSPKNIVDLNTVYDDFNSNIERFGKGFDLYYSSTNDSKGNDYDISCAHFDIFENLARTNVEFEVFSDRAFWAEVIFPFINSDYDELGPFSFIWKNGKNDTHGNFLFLYANDSSGNFDINFINIDITEWSKGTPTQKVYGPVQANVLNSSSNDYYPTINEDFSQFYFCSNRKDGFDIFYANISNPSLVDWLETGKDEAVICSKLSSEYDDKCPYIEGNLLVFSSNRENGFGGFDLWYSVYENNDWSEPINFGSSINSEFDEYRPAIEYFEDSKNDLMIFSSNRPGGRGGYDLYYVGINKINRDF